MANHRKDFRTKGRRMNYEIIQTNENGKFYSIKETETDHIIATFKKSVDAKKMAKHLNLGGGFDGWTPNFFVKK
jgi:hypothetical protein